MKHTDTSVSSEIYIQGVNAWCDNREGVLLQRQCEDSIQTCTFLRFEIEYFLFLVNDNGKETFRYYLNNLESSLNL